MSLIEASVFDAAAPGPRLIVPGAVHGSKTCGTRSIERLLAAPSDNEDRIVNGLCPLLADHDVLLDLHSYRSGGPLRAGARMRQHGDPHSTTEAP